MFDWKGFEKNILIYSEERLKSFIYSSTDSIDDVIIRYSDNIQISQAMYPELCTLEIILRNSIDNTLQKYISSCWLEDEIQKQSLLDDYDHQTLLKAYSATKEDCISAQKTLTRGKIIANLSFGFWTNICSKKYTSAIWNKRNCFKGVFENYPSAKQEISKISKKLYRIRRLRNRIFHYEQIFKYPMKVLNLYNEIMEILSYLPQDNFKTLKRTTNFINTYNSLVSKFIIK